MQWSGWLLLIGMVLLWTTSTASPSNASPRELKALRQALKKQQRLKEQQQQQQQQRTGMKGAVASIGGSGEYVPDAGPWSSTDANEPSCEQLREMWRQSKRHSRAAESTNEIPQYADPFARATSVYARQLAAEPTLRPRPERRPVVYGRLHSSPPMDSDDRAPRPFDVLRKLSRTESDGPSISSEGGGGSGGGSGVVLYSEEDRSPFPKSPAKGSLQHLRELVREEQAGSGVKGSFQQLRDIVREEQGGVRLAPGRSDWSDADIGRVVTSPSDHGASKYALYAMQGDAPYESASSHQQHNGRRLTSSNNYNRLSSAFGVGGKSHHRNHNSNRQQATSSSMMMQLNSELPQEASRKPFQLRDPPRPRLGSGRLAGSRANSNRWLSTNSDSDDVGVIRGYVVGRSNNPLYSSKPSRRSSALATEENDCGEIDFCRRQSDCRCASTGQQLRCQRGRCVPAVGTKKRNQQKRNKQSPLNRDDERDFEENEEESWSSRRDDSEATEQQQSTDESDSLTDESDRPRTRGRNADDIRDIIDALQQIDQESTD